MNLDNFERAFKENGGGCRVRCACGKIYYNHDRTGWDWEENELETLEKDDNAIAIAYSVEYIRFEGVQYVIDCDCWKAQAELIMKFLDGHALCIARYINFEKNRKLKEANAMAEVDCDIDVLIVSSKLRKLIT